MKTPVELAKGWFAKGDSDLGSAKAILGTSGPFDTACFHAQQAVEKYMKGFLDLHGRPYPLIHDVGKLALLCEALDATLRLTAPDVIALTDYAVLLRYDSDFWPTRQTAEEAVAAADRVRGMILAIVPPAAHPT